MECAGDIDSFGRRRRSTRNKNSYFPFLPETQSEALPKGHKVQEVHFKAVEAQIEPSSEGRQRRSAPINEEKKAEIEAKLLPDVVDLGLRLTVGEEELRKPFLASRNGDGHFPESSPYTEPASNAYYPALAGVGGGYTGSLASPQSSISVS